MDSAFFFSGEILIKFNFRKYFLDNFYLFDPFKIRLFKNASLDSIHYLSIILGHFSLEIFPLRMRN